MGFWVRKGTPSIAFGRRSPCQCTVVSSASALVTSMRNRSPWRARNSGPGTRPLYAQAGVSRSGPDAICTMPVAARSVKFLIVGWAGRRVPSAKSAVLAADVAMNDLRVTA